MPLWPQSLHTKQGQEEEGFGAGNSSVRPNYLTASSFLYTFLHIRENGEYGESPIFTLTIP